MKATMSKINKLKIMGKSVICITLLVVIWVTFFCVKENYVNRRISTIYRNMSMLVQVEEIKISKGNIAIKGFAFETYKSAEEGAYIAVLRDIESEKVFFSEMNYSKRDDVNKYFQCEHDFSECGFEAVFDSTEIDFKNENYELLMRKKDESVAYGTDIYIADGKIRYTNPIEFKELDVEGTFLHDIVTNGILRLYRPDLGMYIYQNNGMLYWIVEDKYGFVEGDTYIQYQLETTQKDRLPEYRIENQWYWDNKSFTFSEHELIDKDTGKYRITAKELPTEYSIERILTGNYIEDWIWKQYFRPYYVFD